MIRPGRLLLFLCSVATTAVPSVVSRVQTWTGTYSRKILTHNSQVCFVDEHPATVDTVNLKTEVKVA